MNEWIFANIKLPEFSGFYLTLEKDCGYNMLRLTAEYFDASEKQWINNDDNDKIIYWANMPELPPEENIIF